MQKEIIIVSLIIIVIICVNIITQKYTKNTFYEITTKLDEISSIGQQLHEAKESGDEEPEDTKKILNEKISNLEEYWQKVNKITPLYLEHDELEKVNSSMKKFESYFTLDEYAEAIPELNNCKYILKHIKEKESLQVINLF